MGICVIPFSQEIFNKTSQRCVSMGKMFVFLFKTIIGWSWWNLEISVINTQKLIIIVAYKKADDRLTYYWS